MLSYFDAFTTRSIKVELFQRTRQLRRTLFEFVLVLLGFGIDVSKDVDVGEVNPEPAEQRGHPDRDKDP